MTEFEIKKLKLERELKLEVPFDDMTGDLQFQYQTFIQVNSPSTE